MWLTFLDNLMEGHFFCQTDWETSSTLELYTDAAASKGYGAIFGKHWFGGAFPEAWHSFNITFLELFPIVLAVHIWGSSMTNRCVLFFTDNAALVDIMNKQTFKHTLIMVLLCVVYIIIFYSVLGMFPACRTTKPNTSLAFRSRASRKYTLFFYKNIFYKN